MDGTFDIEVLDLGTHEGNRTLKVTEQDLEEIAANFEALKQYIKPAIKLGHSDAQLLAGQTDGDPALGWVNGLRRSGNKLIATVTNVPQKLVELIRKRRYARVSSELLTKFEETGWERNLKTGRKGKVLTGVALLGADVPAVASLNDLATWLATDDEPRVWVDGPEGLLTLAAERCPHCGGRMDGEQDGKRVCANADCKPPIPRKLSTDAATRRSEVIMPDEANIAALTAELESLKAKQAERDAKDAEREAREAKLAAELAALKTQAADAERRAAEAAAMQRSLEADAFVERNGKPECMRLATPEARDRARALYVKLAAQDGPIVSETEAVTLKLSAEPRTFTAVELFESFVAALPDQKVLLTHTARPQAPQEPESYEERKAKLAADLKLDLTTAEGRAALTRHLLDAAKKNPSQYGFRAKE